MLAIVAFSFYDLTTAKRIHQLQHIYMMAVAFLGCDFCFPFLRIIDQVILEIEAKRHIYINRKFSLNRLSFLEAVLY